MVNIFQHGNCYYTGFVGPFHVRLPHKPDFWLWAAEGAPATMPVYDAHMFAVRVLWRNVPWFQEFCLEKFCDSLEVSQCGF